MTRSEKEKFLAETCKMGEDMLKSAPEELIDQMHAYATQDDDTAGAATAPMEPEERRAELNGEPGESDIGDLTKGKPPEEHDEENPEGLAEGDDHPGEGSDPGPGHDSTVGGGSNYEEPGAETGPGHDDSSNPPGPPAGGETVGPEGDFDEPTRDMGPMSYEEYTSMPEDQQKTMWERTSERAAKHGEDDERKPEEMSEDERKEMAEKFAAKYRAYAHWKPHGESSVSTSTAKPAAKPAAAMSEAGISRMIAETVGKEVGKAMAQITKNWDGKIAKLDKFAERRIAAEKLATVDARLHALVKAGKILPAQVAAFRETAMGLDATVVRKFSDKDTKGKTVQIDRTPFDNFFRRMQDFPDVAKFAERVGTDRNGSAPSKEEAEVEKVSRHYESFREKFPKSITKESLVNGFKAFRKSNPNGTAQEFLSV